MLQPASHEGGGHHLWQGSWGAISAPARPRASSKGFCNGCDQDPGKDRPRGRSQQGPLSKVLWAPARRRASLKGSAVDATRIRARTGPEGRSQEGASVKGPLGPGPAPGLFQRSLGPRPGTGPFQRSLGPRPKGPDQKANRKRDRFQRSLGPRPGPGPPSKVPWAPARRRASFKGPLGPGPRDRTRRPIARGTTFKCPWAPGPARPDFPHAMSLLRPCGHQARQNKI